MKTLAIALFLTFGFYGVQAQSEIKKDTKRAAREIKKVGKEIGRESKKAAKATSKEFKN